MTQDSISSTQEPIDWGWSELVNYIPKEPVCSLDELLKEKNVFLIGKNECSEFIAKNFNVSGLIDDYADEASTWTGLPIKKSADVPKNSAIINCAFSISPLTIQKKLGGMPNIDCLPYSEVYSEKHNLPIPQFVQNTRDDLHKNERRYQETYNSLSDELSRKTFRQILSFKLTGTPYKMEGFKNNTKNQYFEPFLGDLANSVFVDCGGYDGDTSEEFISRYPEYKKIFLFEPSKSNIEKAKIRLSNNEKVTFIPHAVSDKKEILNFNPDDDSSSSINQSGKTKIEAVKLDDYINEPVSMIKMDLEGWELKALTGAKKHIRNNAPILAIAAYHYASDIWKIPEYIRSLTPHYDIYLRHYTDGWSESVLFFVPNNT